MRENRESLSIKKETPKSEMSALQVEWEEKMAKEGLAPIDKPLTDELSEAGLEGDSLDGLAKTERDITESLDRGPTFENEHPSAETYSGQGRQACQRAKLEDARRIAEKDPNLMD